MSIVKRELALLRHPQLAALATSSRPAWLWSIDGSEMLWANAVGAAIFGSATAVAAAQIVRLAATLPAAGQERLERLRGFGASFGRTLTCACSRVVLDDGKPAVLIAAAEPVGPQLPLGERVCQLFADCQEPIASFAPDGQLVYANAAAQARLCGATMLSALGIETLAATVLETGSASGTAQMGNATFAVEATRLGKDASRVLLLTIPQPADKTPVGESARQEMAPSVAIAPRAMPSAEAAATASPAPPVATAAPAAEPASASSAIHETPAERRHPLRFVWHMDADGRFGIGSDEFIELAGPHTTAAFGRPWNEIAAELKLDPANQVARAMASQETWSGITVAWPVDDAAEPLPIELSGLPVFDRDRRFRGYRGFGVCRDIGRINQLVRTRRDHPIGFRPAPVEPQQQEETAPTAPAAPAAAPPDQIEPAAAAAAAPQAERPALAIAPASANVVPFRPSTPPEPKVPPTLSPVERRAFRELAQELTARLRGPEEAPVAAPDDAEGLPAEGLPAEGLPAEAAETGARAEPTAEPVIEQVLLDRIPIGVLVYRHDKLLYANRHFLAWSGYENLAAIEAAGGVSHAVCRDPAPMPLPTPPAPPRSR